MAKREALLELKSLEATNFKATSDDLRNRLNQQMQHQDDLTLAYSRCASHYSETSAVSALFNADRIESNLYTMCAAL